MKHHSDSLRVLALRLISVMPFVATVVNNVTAAAARVTGGRAPVKPPKNPAAPAQRTRSSNNCPTNLRHDALSISAIS